MLTRLSPQLRRKADNLLDQLLKLPSAERPAALARMCENETLLQAVSRLLRAVEIDTSPVDPNTKTSQRLWAQFAADVDQQETPMTAGTVIGSYRILEEINRGGMAVIYRAERIDGEFRREVAVKVLKLGIDTEEIVHRFGQERQILADLDHPNIAGLHDAGHTSDGRPYFVMELVDGQPIDRYCQDRELSIEARLRLFLKVCDAVAYAHQNLVVHRDLKPGNVLVAPTATPNQLARSGKHEDYRVKLLDFGIAHLLEPGASEAVAPTTRALVRVMTPEYASPEQVRGERVTTASDVYQLGLLLYELLTGQRASSLNGFNTRKIEQALREQNPTRLIARPHWLGGDLDKITSKALNRYPARRYSSADRLAEDIRRHLAGFPVSARDDTWFYRTRKFLQRHAVAVVSVTAAIVMVAGTTMFYLSHLKSAYEQAELQRVQAQLERDRAQAVTEFMNDLFGDANSLPSRGNEVTVREMLDYGADALQARDDLSPALKGSMLLAMGRAYNSLGFSRQALPLLSAARPLLADSMTVEEQVGVLRSMANAYSDRGDFKQVMTVANEATELLQSKGAEQSDEMVALQILMLDSQITLMDTPLVQTTAQLEAIVSELEERTGPPPDRLLLQAYMPLSYAYAMLDADDKSVDVARRAGEVAVRRYGHEDMRTLSYRFYHGSGLRRVNPEQAVSILQALAADYQRLTGPNLSLASTLNSLSLALDQMERRAEAKEVSRRAINIVREQSGESNRLYLGAMQHLANLHHQDGQTDKAMMILEEILPALEIKAALGAGLDQVLYARTLSSLARVQTDQGRAEAALRMYAQADQVMRATDPAVWPTVRSQISEGLAASRQALAQQELSDR